MNGFDVTLGDEQDWVSFGRTFVASQSFKSMFRDGMALVEETAAYLDGDGREESRLLSRDATLAYASESMRLTTRLMQIASWLLVQRAVTEGEITPSQVLEEKRRVALSAGDEDASRAEILPLRLQGLIERSRRMHTRILHLDVLIAEDRTTPRPQASPVADQQGMLRSAFSGN